MAERVPSPWRRIPERLQRFLRAADTVVGPGELRRRSFRAGLVVVALLLTAVSVRTLTSLDHIGAQLVQQDARIRAMDAYPVDDRSSLLASHLDSIADTRRLYAAFATGMTAVLVLLGLGVHMVRRAEFFNALVAEQADTLHRSRISAAEEIAKSQEQLRQAQKMEAIGLLAGGVAHDFNNALTVINGYSEMVLGALPPEHPQRARVEEIGRAGARAADITRQLLTFSRRQTSKLSIVDLNATIRDTTKMLQRLVGEDVSVTTQLAPALGKILADPGHVQQVLMNLAVNARDAMPGGGQLSITTEMAGQRDGIDTALVRLTFRDTGCGMDAATQARVFEPFFTTKDVGKGTGLGLSIVFGIVKDSGGVISIESAPGRGAAFIIELPELVTTANAEEPAPTPFPAAVNGTLLYVEDDPQVLAFAREVLSARGYAVLTAAHGEAALALSRGHRGPIDLVVSDLVMPGLPVEEMIAALRADRPLLKLLFVSGYSDRARLHPLVMRGDVPFMEKPFQFSALADLIATTLASASPEPVAA